MTRTILVTGATGQVGGAVVKALASEGFNVRAATRSPENYNGVANVIPVKLDYHEPETIAPALTGVDGLFLIALPLDPKALEELAPVIDQAKKAGLRHIVLHSALGVDQNEEAPLRKVEHYLISSGIGYTILRSNFFMDNFISGALAPMIIEADTINLPAGDGKTSFIATRDIAAAAATAFSRELFGEEFNLTGPEDLDHYQVAAIISEVSGRKITYHLMEEKEFLAMLTKRRGVPETAAHYLAELYSFVRNGYLAGLTGDIKRLTGQEPMTFAAFLAEHAEQLRSGEEVDLPYASRILVGSPGVHLTR